MKIIDIHTHIYPDNIAQKATNTVRNYYGINNCAMDGTESMLLRRGKEAGIERFVLLPVAIRPDIVQNINNFTLQKALGNSAFIPFGTVHAAMDGLTDETQRLIALGMKGIKLHPDHQRFAIDDPRLFPVYEIVQGRIPMLIHTGDPLYNYSHPERLKKVLDLFPNLCVVAAHFGGYSMYDTALEILRGTKCVIDISSSIISMAPGLAEKYINAYGAERVAFGTDYPMFDPVQEVEQFMRLQLTDTQKEQIAYKTAQRLLLLR